MALARLAAAGRWDWDSLRLEVADLELGRVDLSDSGFSAAQIRELLNPTICMEPDPILDESVTRQGDIWALGPHLLACGWASDGELMAKLFSDTKAAALYSAGSASIQSSAIGDQNPVVSTKFEEPLSHLLTSWKAILLPGAPLTLRATSDTLRSWLNAAHALSLDLIDARSATGRKGGREAGPSLFITFSSESRDVPQISFSRVGLHNALKGGRDGTKTLERIIKSLCPIGSIIYDPFVASADMLFAADRCQRRVIACDASPGKVDQEIFRWMRTSGEAAFHHLTGQKFGQRLPAEKNDA